jgi:hypothetical protein
MELASVFVSERKEEEKAGTNRRKCNCQRRIWRGVGRIGSSADLDDKIFWRLKSRDVIRTLWMALSLVFVPIFLPFRKITRPSFRQQSTTTKMSTPEINATNHKQCDTNKRREEKKRKRVASSKQWMRGGTKGCAAKQLMPRWSSLTTKECAGPRSPDPSTELMWELSSTSYSSPPLEPSLVIWVQTCINKPLPRWAGKVQGLLHRGCCIRNEARINRQVIKGEA